MVTVPTSAGAVSVEELGVVLTHEHIFIRTEALQCGSRTSASAPAP